MPFARQLVFVSLQEAPKGVGRMQVCVGGKFDH